MASSGGRASRAPHEPSADRVAGAAVDAHAQMGINITTNLVCGILHLIAAAIPMLFWKLSDRDADGIRERLKARNAASEA